MSNSNDKMQKIKRLVEAQKLCLALFIHNKIVVFMFKGNGRREINSSFHLCTCYSTDDYLYMKCASSTLIEKQGHCVIYGHVRMASSK